MGQFLMNAGYCTPQFLHLIISALEELCCSVAGGEGATGGGTGAAGAWYWGGGAWYCWVPWGGIGGAC